MLHAYRWPGNVRELKGVVSYALNMTQSPVIDAGSLPNFLVSESRSRDGAAPPAAESGAASLNLTQAVRDLERRLITEALAASSNRSEAIRALGISRRTFYLKLKEYGLE